MPCCRVDAQGRGGQGYFYAALVRAKAELLGDVIICTKPEALDDVITCTILLFHLPASTLFSLNCTFSNVFLFNAS